MKLVRMLVASIGTAVLSLMPLGIPASAAENADTAVRHFELSSALDPEQVLDAAGQTRSSMVTTSDRTGAEHQRWTFPRRGGGTVAIVNVQSDLCVTVTGPQERSPLILDKCRKDDPRQRFYQENRPDGVTFFESYLRPHGRCIDMLGRNDVVGLDDCYSPSQGWHLDPA